MPVIAYSRAMSVLRCLAVVIMSVALAACSMQTDDPTSRPTARATSSPKQEANVREIEADLERQIDKKLAVKGTAVECPSKVLWRVGDSFFCDVVSPESAAGFAEVTRIADSRGYSWYISNTCQDEKRKLGHQQPGGVTPTP